MNSFFNVVILLGLASAGVFLAWPGSYWFDAQVKVFDAYGGESPVVLYERTVVGTRRQNWSAEVRRFPSLEQVRGCSGKGDNLYSENEKQTLIRDIDWMVKDDKTKCGLPAGIYTLHICWNFSVMGVPKSVCHDYTPFTVFVPEGIRNNG